MTNPPLLDTHQHLWDLLQFPYSWCAGNPKLNRSFLPADYARAAEGCGIAGTLFMECDIDEPHVLNEARHIQSLVGSHPSILGIIASCRPEKDDFPAQLEALAALPSVRGVRRILHTQPDELSQSPLFAANVRLLAKAGLTFDLCVLARQLPLALALIRACPEVTFILDHCGVPDVKAGASALDPWRENMKKVAELPNVCGKISGIVAYANPERWTVEDLRPWFEHTIACFGWDRVVWGGDWPVCTLSAPLADWVKATRTLTAGASDSERTRLFHRNAERIYRVSLS